MSLKKTRPLKIYLGDLTYTTVTLATEAFPLNVGYIASYCKKLFGNDVEITLFKYIDEIDKAVNENPPDILGLSNYCWSHNVSYEIFKNFENVFASNASSTGSSIKLFGVLESPRAVDTENGQKLGQRMISHRSKAFLFFYIFWRPLCRS